MIRAEVFLSKYLKPEDLSGRPTTVTIDRAPLEHLKSPDGKEQRKIVLYFREIAKAFPLNVTNFDACAAICGADTDDWPGHVIVLYPTKTTMGGKIVPCVRIRPLDQRKKLADEQSPDGEINDEIPF